ncbi:MAG: hypothetical protein CM15mP49_16010 [Actinomycetota bacterium]|nr:MAG: hypothetical protein CM15mP49_16010 [Actinomycetota bacterium]
MNDNRGEKSVGQVPVKVRILLTASFFSALATVGQITIVGKQVYDMTGSELNLGLLGLAEFLPVALLSPFTGPVADRFDRRKVFSLALVAQAITSFLLFSMSPRTLMAVSYLCFHCTFRCRKSLCDACQSRITLLIGLQTMLWSGSCFKVSGFPSWDYCRSRTFGFIFVAGPSFPI